jgi:hypothetical protein
MRRRITRRRTFGAFHFLPLKCWTSLRRPNYPSWCHWNRDAPCLRFRVVQRRTRRLQSFEWRRADSNRRPPACKAGALPAELRPRSPETLPERAPRASHASAPVGELERHLDRRDDLDHAWVHVELGLRGGRGERPSGRARLFDAVARPRTSFTSASAKPRAFAYASAFRRASTTASVHASARAGFSRATHHDGPRIVAWARAIASAMKRPATAAR